MTDGVHFINCIHLKLKIQVTSQKLFIHTPGWHPLNIQEKQIEKKNWNLKHKILIRYDKY
jgi:hypothetical protein